MEFQLLGPVRAWIAGAELDLGPAKRKAILAALLLEAGRPISTDRLIDLIWGEEAPAAAQRVVIVHVSRLRAALRDGGAHEHGVEIVTDGGGYLLRTERGFVDALRFRDDVTGAIAGPAEFHVHLADRAARLRSALAMWRGPALADVGARIRDRLGTGLEALRRTALESRVDADLALGLHQELTAELTELTAEQPTHERFATQLMVACYRAGRPGEATEAYARLRRALVDELGIEPSPAVVEVFRSVLAGDPGLGAPPVRPAPAGTDDGTRPVRQGLPADIADFAGRRAEIARVSEHVGALPSDGTAVVSVLVGMAGSGKTTLAVHLGHLLRNRFPDGCLFIDLKSFTSGRRPLTPAEALDLLLRLWGVDPDDIGTTEEELVAAWRSALTGQRVLLVLDNAGTAAQVRSILPAASGCLTLVTSRVTLSDLDGAQTIALGDLAEPEAEALLRGLLGDRAIDDGEAAEIVRRCGYLPLAIRIAGSRLRIRPAWSAAYLIARLSDERRRLAELSTQERGVAAAFDVSYEHLLPPEQEMFRLLALHPGVDFDAEAAAAMAEIAVADASAALDVLLDGHLLIQRVPDRYAFHDLLREFARDASEAIDSTTRREHAIGRLADHYRATAAAAMDTLIPYERHRRPQLKPAESMPRAFADDDDAHAWLAAERPNLLAVAAIAADHGLYDHAPDLSAIIWRFLDRSGHYADALALHGHAMRAATDSGDIVRQANSARHLGAVYWRLARHAEATEYMSRAVELSRAAGDDAGVAAALTNLGVVYLQIGNPESIARLKDALAMYEQIGDLAGQASASANIGAATKDRGQAGAALVWYDRARSLNRQLGDIAGEAIANLNSGLLHLHLGRHAEALDLMHEALTLFEQGNYYKGRIDALTGLAEVYLGTGDHDAASTYLDQAVALRHANGDSEDQDGDLLNLRATLQGRLGDFDRALMTHRQAIEIARDTEDRVLEAIATHGMAATVRLSGDLSGAADLYGTAIAVAEETGTRWDSADMHSKLAETVAALGDVEAARAHWTVALAIYDEAGSPEADRVRRHLADLA